MALPKILISSNYTLPAATETILGGVKVAVVSAVSESPASDVFYMSTEADDSTDYTLPAATDMTLGGVKIGEGISVTTDGTISAAGTYTLPVATDTTLGGVKADGNIAVDTDGTLTYTLPEAAETTLGGVKVSVVSSMPSSPESDVFYLTEAEDSPAYTLPAATSTTLGGIKVGTNLSIDSDGVLSATGSYLPLTGGTVTGKTTINGVNIGGSDSDEDHIVVDASTGMEIGTYGDSIRIYTNHGNEITIGGGDLSDSISMTSAGIAIKAIGSSTSGTGVISATDSNGTISDVLGAIRSAQYTLPVATDSVLGGVKCDGNVTADSDGTLTYTLPSATATTLGGIKLSVVDALPSSPESDVLYLVKES